MNLNNLEFNKEKWFVLKVKHRHEKKVTKILENKNFKVYNPTINVFRKWSDRVKRLVVPAIPGIIFIKINLKEKNNVFCSSSIKGWFYENKNAVSVDNKELELLEESLNKRNWISCNKEINIGDIIFLEHLGINIIINKIGMSNIWAYVKNTNYTLKLDKIKV